jgi:DNA ligase-associated metallophosphoesterase
MTGYAFSFSNHIMRALPSGALFWPDRSLLCLADLHLGKGQRAALAGGAPLPPYEVRDTLIRLAEDLRLTGAHVVVALGDSLDDPSAGDRLSIPDRSFLADLMRGRDWIWIAGNHDRGDPGLGGRHGPELRLDGLIWRHIAHPGATAEISGHYHPKVRLPVGRASRPAFLVDPERIILPAYGTYTGGLAADAEPLSGLMGPRARAIVTNRQCPEGAPLILPLHRHGRPRGRGPG